MKPTSRLILQAFLISIAEQEDIPNDWQSQLVKFDWDSDKGIAQVYKWAGQNLPTYKSWYRQLGNSLAQRSKGKPTRVNWERENQLTQEEYRNFLQQSDDRLIENAKAISQNPGARQSWRERLFSGSARG